MQPLLLLLLLAAGQGVESINYKITGFYSQVTVDDVIDKLTARGSFAPYEDLIRTRFNQLLNNDLDEFFITEFLTNGLDTSKPTATFKGYLSSSLTKKAILDAVQPSGDMVLLFTLAVDELPVAPSMMVVAPETQPQVDAGVTSCYGGGILLPNKTCVCPPFAMDNQCSTQVCLHRGVQDDGVCQCPPGSYGANCEPKSCVPTVLDTIDNYKQTFTVVISQRTSMSYVISRIINNIQVLLDNNQQNGLIFNYVIVHYISSPALTSLAIEGTSDPKEFIQLLNGVVPVDGDDTQPTIQATLAAHNTLVDARGYSNMYVFFDTPDVAGTPSDYTLSSSSDETNLIQTANAWRNRIVFVPSAVESSGGSFQTYGNYYDVFRRVAKATLGDLIPIAALEINEVFTKVLVHYQQNEVIDAGYFMTGTKTVTVKGDTDDQPLYIVVSTEPDTAVPKITDGSGSAVTPDFTGNHTAFISTTSGKISSIVVTPVANDKAWSYRIFVQSPVSQLISFTTDNSVDVGNEYMEAEIVNQVTTLTLGVVPTGVSMTIVDPTSGATIVNTVAAVARASCSYNYKIDLGTYTCTTGPLLHKFTITSASGTFTRAVPSLCVTMAHHDAVPFTCLNNGTRSGAQTCKCTGSFTGRNCEIPVCKYGGSPNPFPGNGNPICLCPFGYGGDFCDTLTCASRTGDTFNYVKRSLVYVIQNSMSQAQVNSKINSGTTILLKLMTGDDMFNEYVLSTFNTVLDNGANVPQNNIASFASGTAFQAALSTADIRYKNSPVDQQMTFSAVIATIGSISYDKSSIFLYVDAPAQDANLLDILVKKAIDRQFDINIIITSPFNMTGLCMDEASAATYVKLAQRTGGTILNLCKPYGAYSGNPIVQYLYVYGNTHHHAENLVEVYSKAGDTAQVNFIVDDPQAPVYAFVNSENCETYTASYVDNENPSTTIPLTTIQPLPFIAIYQIRPSYFNVKGYTLSVTCADTTVTGMVVTRVTEKSDISVTLGFTPAPNMDSFGHNLLFGSSANPTVHVSSVFQTQPTVSLTFKGEYPGGDGYTSTAVYRKSTCSYTYFFPDQFTCQKISTDFSVTAMVQIGNVTIQRTNRAYCYLEANQCLNGGKSQNGTCQCPTGYNGTYCENPICQNGGSVENFKCDCPAQYNGLLCQYAMCHNWNYVETHDVRTQTFQQITFVMNINKDQLLTNIYMSQLITDYILFANFATDLMTPLYTLVTFDETNINNVISTTNTKLFINVFTQAIASSNYTKTQATATLASQAIYDATQLTITPPTMLYLFTGSPTTKPNVGLTEYMKQRIGTQVNIITTPLSTAPGPPAGDFGYTLTSSAKTSNGRVLSMNPNSIASINDALVSTLTENAMLLDDAAKDCTKGANFTFYAESTFTTLVLTITGNGVSVSGAVTITDPGNNVVSAKGLFIDGPISPYTAIYSVGNTTSTTPGGLWTVNVKSTSGACYLQARAQSPIHVVNGFTSDMNSDFVKDSPFANFGTVNSNYMALRVTSGQTTNRDVTLTNVHVDTYDVENPWDKKDLQDIKINPRDNLGCSYNFISEAFAYNPTKSTVQRFVIYGLDKNQNQFQRSFTILYNKDATSTCVNGDRNNNGECICKPGYAGDYCMGKVCQNGGSPSLGACVCTDGYFGDFCEKYIPLSSVTTTFQPPVVTSGAPVGSTNAPQGSTVVNTQQPVTTPVAVQTTSGAVASSTVVVAPTGFPTRGPNCDPVSTTYFVSFFIDATNGMPLDAAEQLIAQTAANLSLGAVFGGIQHTRFLLGGVVDDYYLGGNITNQTYIQPTVNNIAAQLAGNANPLDLVKAATTYTNTVSDYTFDNTNEKPPFAVLLMNSPVSSASLTTTKGLLNGKKYEVLGVSMTSTDTYNSLAQVLGPQNTYANGKDTNNAAQFIVDRLCAYKPL